MYKNKLFKLLFKILIVLFSYGYIYYKYKSSNIDLYSLPSVNFDFLLFSISLMPLNWILESIKWRVLLKDIERISIKESFLGVLIGITSGLATPNRIGEYAGRTFVLKKGNRVKGSLATMLGSWSQVLVTLILGLIGWILLFEEVHVFSNLTYRPIFILMLISIMILMLLFYYNLQWIRIILQKFSLNKRYIDEIRFLIRFTKIELTEILLLSFLRYVVFASQYILLLFAFGSHISITDSLSAIFLIYLIIVFIPHFSISELGIRASVAIFVFQAFTNELSVVALAASVLWFINLAIPSIIGSFYILSGQITKYKNVVGNYPN